MSNYDIGKRITIARESVGMNRKQLAEKIKVAASTITRYEKGSFDKIKMPIIDAIGRVTGVDPKWIIGKSDRQYIEDPRILSYDYSLDQIHRVFKENGYTDISQESPFCVFTSHDGDVLTFHEGDLVHRVEELRLAEQPITFLALANTHSDFTPEEQERLNAILATVEKPSYYLNPETAKLAQEVFDDPNLRVLFDAAKNSRPEDLRMAADLLKRLKATNPDG